MGELGAGIGGHLVWLVTDMFPWQLGIPGRGREKLSLCQCRVHARRGVPGRKEY